jgi:hypothetical protein
MPDPEIHMTALNQAGTISGSTTSGHPAKTSIDVVDAAGRSQFSQD